MAQQRTASKPTASKKSTAKPTVAKGPASKTTRATKTTVGTTKPNIAAKPKSATKPKAEQQAKVAPKPKTAVTLSSARNAPPHRHNIAVLALRAFGLSYPEAHLKSPWPEHLDLAIRDKTFAYLSIEGEPLRLSCKLPQSSQTALDLEFTEPTGYGLGKSGWVTATFKEEDDPPIEFLKTWIDESYRAQAPKSLTKALPKIT